MNEEINLKLSYKQAKWIVELLGDLPINQIVYDLGLGKEAQDFFLGLFTALDNIDSAP